MISSNEIRKSFIEYFNELGHANVKSSPLIPHDDPTLLFTNAGMNQFKNIFLGENNEKYKRAVNSQKCMRVSGKHNDLEVVGRDTYHHTFFEMLGNWSFGDYYKAEAIEWAWKLLTDKWKLPVDKLYVTVYKDDEEAKELWPKVTGISPERVLKFGKRDNFWEMGDTGPCGPCSEIHIDLGADRCDKKHVKGHKCGVNQDCARYIELWNLVFIQYNRDSDGVLHELPTKHIDTGMGFERICSVIQNVKSNYDTDLFTPIISAIEEITGVKYSRTEKGVPFRVIADHVRALSFAITDGGIPKNDGRGYVLRRLLRRASRFARELNVKEPFIYKLVDVVSDSMKDAFPEISQRRDYVKETIKSEEERFGQTLDLGIDYFNSIADKLEKENKSANKKIIIPGEIAFKLYDTYGFPSDLTCLMASDRGMDVDMNAYDVSMEEQKQRARNAGKEDSKSSMLTPDGWNELTDIKDTAFTGYENLKENIKIARYKTDGNKIVFITDKTPFYAESGGQVGDKGTLSNGNIAIDVVDVIKWNNFIVHKGILPNDMDLAILKGIFVAEVDKKRRNSIKRNHSATHLLQSALKIVLGDHVQQSGSRVDDKTLRFDFIHTKALTDDEIKRVEYIVNDEIRKNHLVSTRILSLEEAKKTGAMALFGEKYDDKVRVVEMGTASKELCGGTHVGMTGEVGVFHIVAEESVASGIRRIEALTGEYCLDYFNERLSVLGNIGKIFKVPPVKAFDFVEKEIAHRKGLEKEISLLKSQEALSKVDSILALKKSINGVDSIVKHIENVGKDVFGKMVDAVYDKVINERMVVVLVAEINSKLSVASIVSKKLTKENSLLKAGDIVKKLASIADGKGGGRPDRAQAGCKDVSKIKELIDAVPGVLKEFMPTD